MCGIALIVSGIRLESAVSDSTTQQLICSVEHIEAAVRRRGPDSLGSKKLFLHPKISSNNSEQCIVSWIEDKGEVENSYTPQCGGDNENGLSEDGATDIREGSFGMPKSGGEMYFIGATLQLRGIDPIAQPFVDKHGNVLVYNGEIFGGILVGMDSNDGEILFHHLGNCCCCKSHEPGCSCSYSEHEQFSVPDVLSRIKGPWSIIYWQDSSKTLWFGRDAFGRRSLLVHWPTAEDPRFLLSSVSPSSPTEESSDAVLKNGHGQLKYWEELPCGIHSMTIDADLVGEIKKCDWSNSSLEELIHWERTYVDPQEVGSGNHAIQPTAVHVNPTSGPTEDVLAEKVLTAIKESVMRRTTLNTFFQAVTSDARQHQIAPVAVLFSGGLDSMILAALLDKCLDPTHEVDLLNVSFDGPSAPDRISARTGIEELTRIAPLRRWRLVEIDAALSGLTSELKHVTSLIHPSNTYMDLNIGMALWLAARGKGWVYEGRENEDEEALKQGYQSQSRILLVGSGADEQCAGYGRHRTSYRKGSWIGLHEEMRLDMQRIWKRNLGRDDRCISDNGKEARFPFLDEDVIKILLDIPLWGIADLEQPSGVGDKKILREVARLLGLSEASTLPKRAIQFGSRIARESNRKNFGSNRAANQAAAGSVTIRMT